MKYDINQPKKYLIFKGTGGINHMLLSLIYCVDFCVKTNRILIIDTAHHQPFDIDFNCIFNLVGVEYYTNYDMLTDLPTHNELTIDIIKQSGCYLINNRYYLDNVEISGILDINSNLQILVFGGTSKLPFNDGYALMNKYLRINSQIKQYIKTKHINEKYIGIHYRNTDLQHSIEEVYNQIDIIQQQEQINTIYLATDDFTCKDKILEKYNVNIISYTNLPQYRINNLHYLTNDEAQALNLTKYDLIVDSITDLYLLTHATHFIQSNKSGFSGFVNYMRKHKNIFNL